VSKLPTACNRVHILYGSVVRAAVRRRSSRMREGVEDLGSHGHAVVCSRGSDRVSQRVVNEVFRSTLLGVQSRSSQSRIKMEAVSSLHTCGSFRVTYSYQDKRTVNEANFTLHHESPCQAPFSHAAERERSRVQAWLSMLTTLVCYAFRRVVSHTGFPSGTQLSDSSASCTQNLPPDTERSQLSVFGCVLMEPQFRN